MSGKRCMYCGQDARQEVSFSEQVANGRRRYVVEGLLKTVCSNCGEGTITRAQSSHNAALIDSIVSSVPTLVTPAFVRNLRELWDLTQKQASRLFGAGENAFAKWESGQVPSGPAALLLQTAVAVPGVMEFLAKLSHVDLPSKAVDVAAAERSMYRNRAHVQIKTDCINKHRNGRHLSFNRGTAYRTDRLSVGEA